MERTELGNAVTRGSIALIIGIHSCAVWVRYRYCVAPGDVSQCVPGQTPDFPEGHYPNHTTGALVQRQQDGHLWKLIIGPAQQATWYGSFSPNATSGPINYGEFVACWPQPCLFDITADPTEHADQYTAQPQIARSLMARWVVVHVHMVVLILTPTSVHPDNRFLRRVFCAHAYVYVQLSQSIPHCSNLLLGDAGIEVTSVRLQYPLLRDLLYH